MRRLLLQKHLNKNRNNESINLSKTKIELLLQQTDVKVIKLK